MRVGHGAPPLGTSPFFFLTWTLAISKGGKTRKILLFSTTWMDLEGIMLSEKRQTEKDKYSIEYNKKEAD